jgi:hypothetical protein
VFEKLKQKIQEKRALTVYHAQADRDISDETYFEYLELCWRVRESAAPARVKAHYQEIESRVSALRVAVLYASARDLLRSRKCNRAVTELISFYKMLEERKEEVAQYC